MSNIALTAGKGRILSGLLIYVNARPCLSSLAEILWTNSPIYGIIHPQLVYSLITHICTLLLTHFTLPSGGHLMAHEKIRRITNRCDNCCFSTFAAGPEQTAFITYTFSGVEKNSKCRISYSKEVKNLFNLGLNLSVMSNDTITPFAFPTIAFLSTNPKTLESLLLSLLYPITK